MAVNCTNISDVRLNVHVIIDKPLLGANLKLVGTDTNHKDTFDSTEPLDLSVGKVIVPVRVVPRLANSEPPWGVAGDISWEFHSVKGDEVLHLNKTRLEFYTVNYQLPSFFRK